ncbi:MAG: filamentous hemagglutinin N-terminal domain-containing protein [Cyanobacteria bacterium J06614_10]
MRSLFSVILYALCIFGFASRAKAQSHSSASPSAPLVSTDNSLNTTVTGNSAQQQFVVTGGTINGQSLFHSFETFSPDAWSVLFDLDGSAYTDIDLIINRVTGQHPSTINGILEIKGGNSPDLLLVNPTGIVFGPNAELSLPSSFLASTAEQLLFGDVSLETTSATDLPPLLSISVPTGLQMTPQSGQITQIGNGHELAVQDESNPVFSPYVFPATQANLGLAVETGKTLSFVGNGIAVVGGILNAPAGHINLSSISSGEVSLSQGGQVSHRPLTPTDIAFNDILLSQRALADTSSPSVATENAILMQGQNIVLDDGSVVRSQSEGAASAGDITVTATSSLQLYGQLTPGLIVSSISADTVGPGDSGTVSVTAPKISLYDGSLLGSRSFSPGEGGTVTIHSDELVVEGYAAIAPNLFTHAGSFTVGTGKAGDVTVQANQQLSVTEGGYVGSSTLFSSGDGGHVHVEASDILVDGSTPSGVLSLIAASAIAGNGSSGNLTVVTERLSVTNSGGVISSSFTDGSAGNIDIAATDWIRIGGQIPEVRESTISSGVTLAPPIYQQFLGNSQTPTGHAGAVDITTGRLFIDEGGALNVANLGTGQAGALDAKAQSIVLNGGDISAVTVSGQGGNIILDTQTLRSHQGSLIQATSLGTGDGGNIEIDAQFVIGRENSDIIANAADGRGGNINITTQGIFGLQFRSQLTPQSDITASSKLGIDGTVQIENSGLNANSGLVSLPSYFSDVDNEVTASCSGDGNNQFVASGRGGLTLNPAEQLGATRPWQDFRAVGNILQSASADTLAPAQVSLSSDTVLPSAIAEAVHWQRNSQNEVELIATGAAELPTPHCLERESHGLS